MRVCISMFSRIEMQQIINTVHYFKFQLSFVQKIFSESPIIKSILKIDVHAQKLFRSSWLKRKLKIILNTLSGGLRREKLKFSFFVVVKTSRDLCDQISLWKGLEDPCRSHCWSVAVGGSKRTWTGVFSDEIVAVWAIVGEDFHGFNAEGDEAAAAEASQKCNPNGCKPSTQACLGFDMSSIKKNFSVKIKNLNNNLN